METKVISGMQHKLTRLPENYIRPLTERPNHSEVVSDAQFNIPIIDLSCPDNTLIINQIRDACRDYGFFQVINHGVATEIVDAMLGVSHEFFGLPIEEKMKFYSEDTTKTIRLSASFNVNNETVNNWRDYLRFHSYPLDKYIPDWPSTPSSFRDTVRSYCIDVRKLAFRLEEVISESLGLDKHNVRNVLGEEQGQHTCINYYPACPEPDLTYGLPAHTDPNAITILLQDFQVEGLQILKDGKWLAIKPKPGAFVINLGDQIQALSNGKYKSACHRALVNANKPRLSIASFICPSDGVKISAPDELINRGDEKIYKDFTYEEYYKKFWSGNLDQACLETFKN